MRNFFVLILFFSVTNAFACIPPAGVWRSVLENGRLADLVIVGEFVEYEESENSNLIHGLAKIKILDTWKGEYSQDYFLIQDSELECFDARFNPRTNDIGSTYLFAIHSIRDGKVRLSWLSEQYREIQGNYLVRQVKNKNGVKIHRLSTYLAKKIIRGKGLKP